MMDTLSNKSSVSGPPLEIKIDEQKLQEVREMLASIPKGIDIAVSRAINRTVITIRANTARRISGYLNLRISSIKESLDMSKATQDRWQAGFAIYGRRIPVYDYAARQNEKGVSYKIERKGSRGFIRSAFIQTMKSGHKGVFQRGGKKRLPIFERFGPSLGYVFEYSGDILKQTTAEAYQHLERNLDSQVKLLLGG